MPPDRDLPDAVRDVADYATVIDLNADGQWSWSVLLDNASIAEGWSFWRVMAERRARHAIQAHRRLTAKRLAYRAEHPEYSA